MLAATPVPSEIGDLGSTTCASFEDFRAQGDSGGLGQYNWFVKMRVLQHSLLYVCFVQF